MMTGKCLMPTKNIKLKVSKELKNDKLDKTTIAKNGDNMSGMERLHVTYEFG